MNVKAITDLPESSELLGPELVEISQLNPSVTISAATISAAASDNSFNDSADGFVAAGFTEGMRVNVQGAAETVNNLFVGYVTALTAGKMTIGGTDGDPIIDEAAGATITITQWVSRRTTLTQIIAAADVVKYRFGFSIENAEPDPAEVLLRHVLQEDVSFAEDFAGSFARLAPSASPPATEQVFTIKRNGTSVGTLTLSDAGAFTWDATAFVGDAGDEIRVEAPGAPDANLVGIAVIFYGEEYVE